MQSINWQEFAQHLSDILQMAIKIDHATPVHGGDINQAFKIQSNQQQWFLKLNHHSCLSMMQSELNNLKIIQASQALTCPNPIAAGIFENWAWLLMDYMSISHSGDDFARGKSLAKMHQTLSPNGKFGWQEDNFIGTTTQYNDWQSEWEAFYGQQRLKPQVDWALTNGANPSLHRKAQTLIARLPKFFEDYQPLPSLLHGDLWGGNSGFNAKGQPLIFDPASYYGDRETDLAMTRLFGGFSADFYHGYEQYWPTNKNAQQRIELYNLYHILNHFNLFGGHYAQKADSIIERLLESL